MKDKIFGVLQRVGRSFMLPIAILPVAGLLLGIGSSLTNATTIETYGLEGILGDGTLLNALLTIMSQAGNVIFDNLPLIFAVGVAIGMAKKEKEVAALASMISFFVMHTTISAVLQVQGQILEDGSIASSVLPGTIAEVCGIPTLQMGVFGGIIVGLGVAALHNRFYKIQLPNALSFFGGSRFVPIISTVVYLFVGIAMYFVWPVVQNGIYALGGLVTGTGYLGTLIFGIIKRALIPFGLHHVFYLPFWQTAVGGTMEVAGQLVQGGQNIFFAQLADPSTVHFSADATRYFSGEFIFMIFGLPGAALAMYRCAKPEKKKQAGGLLLSAALTCMLTGITEPLEFSFLFVAPILFVVQVILAGAAYMIAHILNIAVGLTFSGGFIDLFIFGILQGNEKTDWMRIIPVGIIYFILYFVIFSFLIKKLDLKTPGREDTEETKLYTKADYKARQEGGSQSSGQALSLEDEKSMLITRGLGGKKNISDVDCCATRLRCTVVDPEKVNESILKQTGPSGIIKKGQGIQIIYGPSVSVIKSNLEEYLAGAPEEEAFYEEAASTEPVSQPVEKEEGQEKEFPKKSGAVRKLCSPFNGRAASITETPDEAFAEKMMGDGYVVFPSEGVVYAPEDCEISFVFPSKHALGLRTEDGLEYLLHIGVDTVKLEGKGFEVFVQENDKVKKGDKLMEFDIEYIKEHAKSEACIGVFTSLEEGQEIVMKAEGEIRALDEIAEITGF
ncbi:MULTISPECIES: PTS transporter subunit IIABC [unclassified Blautia]|uniref:PTS transporter subunit IIABC n=1 Tax=unclassified Blautia TaxID=2648079 RepID=UPI000B36B53C|nr:MULTISPECIES: PTS transporter subunit IIABC [unclassified Blautia]OUN29924.1 PTS glucose transporter subunit IIA [Blautia sp. An81]OUN94436.1 PTS glucose transporter subunit IIA [Blautia sp. An46]